MDTAAIRSNLESRYKAVSAELAALDSTKAGGKPDTNQPGAVSHQAYKQGLLDELAQLEARLKALSDLDPDEGVVEVRVNGVT